KHSIDEAEQDYEKHQEENLNMYPKEEMKLVFYTTVNKDSNPNSCKVKTWWDFIFYLTLWHINIFEILAMKHAITYVYHTKVNTILFGNKRHLVTLVSSSELVIMLQHTSLMQGQYIYIYISLDIYVWNAADSLPSEFCAYVNEENYY
ncbi:hypothetical protein ACJX0J_036994, partial [Zea mays]